MKKFITLLIGLGIYMFADAQVSNDSTLTYQQLLEYYKTASQEEKAVMDSLFVSVADAQRGQQVK